MCKEAVQVYEMFWIIVSNEELHWTRNKKIGKPIFLHAFPVYCSII